MITMLGEADGSGQAPYYSEVYDDGVFDDKDLMVWASQYDLTHPVLADVGLDEYANYLWAVPGFDGGFGLPNMVLLSPGLQVESSNTNSLSASAIEALLPN